MADDTFTESLKARLIAQGNYSNAYAARFNEDALALLDAAIAGKLIIDIGSDTEYLLEDLQEGTLSETHYRWLIFIGSPASAVTIIVPTSVDNAKGYIVENLTGQILTFKYASTDAVRLLNTQSVLVECDGTEVRPLQIGYEVTDEEITAGVDSLEDPSMPPAEPARYGTDDDAITTAVAVGALMLIPKVFSGKIVLSGVLSPTIIASTQNNYNPAGLANANILRLTSSTSVSLTGLVLGPHGKFLPTINVGSNNIILEHNDAGSDDENKFDIGADITLGAGEGAILWYDEDSERVRCLARSN